ncbi:hypothetical protein OLMES_1589 [Oleiphilus messinensis]|uniref:PNPLA domain-containing protein n=1 Tax=Oleiphilus messinensis TaxID=141451 RepID=A0A1Y0I896_9GAMM|nr:patatin-like phospholipase family protein [Oleiphilus messinensis]ARU55664.1 hypothetical protein OLMES_1589 [Oleiphilus messinensis]
MTHTSSCLLPFFISGLGLVCMMIMSCQIGLPSKTEMQRLDQPRTRLEISNNPYSYGFDSSPNLCVALSGGGIRSGAISIGFLQRTVETNLLQKIDIISTVSGGGYALYWLYSGAYEASFMSADKQTSVLQRLIAEDGPAIQRLDQTHFIDTSDAWWEIAFNSPGVPFDILLRRLIGAKSVASESYASDIRRKFGSSDLGIRNIKLQNLHVLVEYMDFPYPIIVTSANRGTAAPMEGHSYSKEALLELSPDWIGSKKVGYHNFMEPSEGYLEKHFERKSWMQSIINFELLEAITVSAAAVDTPKSNENIVPNIAKLLGYSLGRSYNTNIGPQFLTDGGFIENLGVLPLIQRGCKYIISLDTSHDPDWKLEDLQVLISYAKEEDWLLTENSEAIVNSLKSQSKEHKGWKTKNPIVNLEFAHEDTGRVLTLSSLKLSISTDLLKNGGYSQPISNFINQNWLKWPYPACNEKKGLDEECAFPFESTFKQDYTPEEFKAYRFLGKHLFNEWSKTQSDHLD